MTFSLQTILYIVIVQFFAFFVKGLTGFGNPLISNPLLSMKLDNKTITPGNLLMDIPVNTYIAWKNRSSFSLKKTLPIAISVMAGVIPGTYLLTLSSPWILKAILGVLVMGLGVEMLTRDRKNKNKANPIIMTIVSFISGVCSGMFGINMLFVAYTERTSVDRNEFRGNICFVFLLENIFRLINYIILGVFTKASLVLFAVSVPAILLGMITGSKVDKKLDEAKIKKMVIFLFILGGISILIKALIFKS